MQRDNRPHPDDLATVQRAPVTDPIIGRTTPTAQPHPATTKCTITIDSDLLGRARTAFLTHGIPDGHRSFSAWISAAIAQAVNDIETHTGTLPPLDAGHLPTGRLPGDPS